MPYAAADVVDVTFRFAVCTRRPAYFQQRDNRRRDLRHTCLIRHYIYTAIVIFASRS